jgi:serine/threonine protein kinase
MSLKQYIETFNLKQLDWGKRERDLWYLLRKMVWIAFRLKEKNLFHSDFKPQNFILDLDSKMETFHLKLIDFGSLSKDHKIIISRTPQFFPEGYLGLLGDEGGLELRFWAELYQIGRTLLYVIINNKSNLVNQFNNL